jgi:hypothetical protein
MPFLARLIAQYGRGMGLPELRIVVARRLPARQGREHQRPLWSPLPAAAGAVPDEATVVRWLADTVAWIGIAISVVGLIGCGITALLTRRR